MELYGQTQSRLKKVKGKMYDVGTSNKSFLQVAADLKKIGIKNYYFMLELIDTSLVGINPYATNLTKDQISRIILECTRNIWYYLREVCRIPSSGGQPIPYKANRGNIAQTWCCIHGIDSWLCLPRQQGKTQSALAIIAWAYTFGTNASDFIFINKDGDNAKANLNRIKSQIDCLPEYLHFDQILEEDENGKVKVVKATKNATTMKHPVTNNRIIIKSKATSYEAALSIARGLTAPIQHFDEPEFTNHIKTIISNSFSTYSTAAEHAKKNHALYNRLFSCTPGDLDTSMGEEAQQILDGTTKWTEKMYDMYYDRDNDEKNEVLKYVKDNGSNRIVYIEYSYKQIGLDDKWLRDQYDGINDPITFRREVLLQRLHGSSDSPFDQEDIEYMMTRIQAIVEELYILGHFRFDVYEHLNRTIPYLVGVDCSTGTNSDNNAITIINPYTAKPVAEFKCPYIGETMFEKLLIELVKDHIPRSIVIIERNSVGDGIVDHLLNSPIASRLYFDKNKDLLENNLREASTVISMLKKQGEAKKYYGVYTEGKSRENMISILFRRIAEYKDDFITKNVTEDIAKLVKTKSGKIEAGANAHDDSIMSYLIAMYVYYHGNNLAAFGFIKGSEEIENQNRGLHHATADEIKLANVLPDYVVDKMKKQEAVQKENDYSEVLRLAILQSQKDSLVMKQKNLIDNTVLDNTPSELLNTGYDEGEIDIDIFNELNGL